MFVCGIHVWSTMLMFSIQDRQYYVWYPWYPIFIAGIKFLNPISTNHNIFVWVLDTQCLYSIDDRQFSWLVSMIHNIYFSIHDTQLFRSSVHDAQYLCLVSMIHNIYIWYPWYTICMPGINGMVPWYPW